MAQPTLFPESGFRRLRIDIAYDGTAFFGWAAQPDKRTIQDLVEDAIARISRSDVESVVAGRTDAGVHATGQVIHVDLPDALFSEGLSFIDLRYKLNRILDEDLRVMNISDAPSGFHARFSALRRVYTYKILDNNEVIAPLARYDVAPWYRPLDVD
jgi:tRNA pseudouridine38-40 synthase